MKKSNQNRKSSKRASMLMMVLLVCLSAQVKLHSEESELSNLFDEKKQPRMTEGYVGISLTMVPRDIVEEEISQIPMLNACLKLKLNDYVSVNSRFMSNYLTNSFSLGVSLKNKYSNMYLTVSDLTEGWIGSCKMTGFKAETYGVKNYPSVAVGMKLNNYTLEANITGILNLTQSAKVGNSSFKVTQTPMSGVSLGLNLEHNVWSGNSVVIGVQLNYSTPSMAAWLAFSELKNRALYPQLNLGYKL